MLTAIELGTKTLTAVTVKINGRGPEIVQSGTAELGGVDAESIRLALGQDGRLGAPGHPRRSPRAGAAPGAGAARRHSRRARRDGPLPGRARDAPAPRPGPLFLRRNGARRREGARAGGRGSARGPRSGGDRRRGRGNEGRGRVRELVRAAVALRQRRARRARGSRRRRGGDPRHRPRPHGVLAHRAPRGRLLPRPCGAGDPAHPALVRHQGRGAARRPHPPRGRRTGRDRVRDGGRPGARPQHHDRRTRHARRPPRRRASAPACSAGRRCPTCSTRPWWSESSSYPPPPHRRPGRGRGPHAVRLVADRDRVQAVGSREEEAAAREPPAARDGACEDDPGDPAGRPVVPDAERVDRRPDRAPPEHDHVQPLDRHRELRRPRRSSGSRARRGTTTT